MISRDGVRRIASREGVSLHAVERDYLEHLLLRGLGKPPLAFKGGTCLRIVMGSPRFSEDLDFSLVGRISGLDTVLRGSARELGRFGINSQWVIDHRDTTSTRGRVRYEGPLFDGSDRSRGSIRIEISHRRERPATQEKLVPRTSYPEVPQLVVTTLRDEELLAEKIRALLIRAAPRDVYDLNFLLARGISAPGPLIQRKLSIYPTASGRFNLEESLGIAQQTWERDLRPLLRSVPPFEDTAAPIRIFWASAGVTPP